VLQLDHIDGDSDNNYPKNLRLLCPNCHAQTENFGSKGKGSKADDNLVAALCLACHYEIDQGAHLSKDERKEMWLKAHKATIETLGDKWPTEVPIPYLPL
jgi:hypothetical protein